MLLLPTLPVLIAQQNMQRSGAGPGLNSARRLWKLCLHGAAVQPAFFRCPVTAALQIASSVALCAAPGVTHLSEFVAYPAACCSRGAVLAPEVTSDNVGQSRGCPELRYELTYSSSRWSRKEGEMSSFKKSIRAGFAPHTFSCFFHSFRS